MVTILFQGDSITDAERRDEYICGLGRGYPGYVAGRLGLAQPNDYRFINRGISGNRIVDIYARIKQDIINLKPDVISFLVGVNDAWHEIYWQNGVATEKFKRIYKMMIDEIREALPEVKIILMEPFVLEGTATEAHYAQFRADVSEKAEAVRQIAEEYSLPFIALQEDLDKLAEKAPSSHLLIDGVHPTIYFHQYMADKWLETYRQQ